MHSFLKLNSIILSTLVLSACGSSSDTTENSPATGGFDLTGAFTEAQTVTVTPNISDADGLINASYLYTWYSDNTIIEGNTSNAITFTADQIGKAIRFEAVFNDDRGHAEVIASDTYTVANNDPLLTITLTGYLRIEQTLTAVVEFVDDNGVNSASLSYQWYTGNTAIEDANSASINLNTSLEGSDVYLQVSFTNNNGFQKTELSETINVGPAFKISLLADSSHTITHGQSSDAGQSWSAFTQFTVSDTASEYNYYPSVATDNDGNLVMIALSEASKDSNPAYAYDYTLITSYSHDNGATWSNTTPLTSTLAVGAADTPPDLTYDGNGNWIAVWLSYEDYLLTGTDADVFYAVSTDKGVTWSAPALVNGYGTSDTTLDDNPMIDANGDNWFIAWHSRRQPNGTDGSDYDLYGIYSDDAGITWSTPTALNPDAATDSDSDYLGVVTINADGKGALAYSAGNDGDLDIYAIITSDHGQTWSSPVVVNSDNASDTAMHDYPTSVIVTDQAIVVAWEGVTPTTGSDTEAVVSYSTNNGSSWSDVIILNALPASDTEDEEAPTIIQTPNGGWLASFISGGDVYTSTSSDLQTWAAPQAIGIDAYYQTDWLFH